MKKKMCMKYGEKCIIVRHHEFCSKTLKLSYTAQKSMLFKRQRKDL